MWDPVLYVAEYDHLFPGKSTIMLLIRSGIRYTKTHGRRIAKSSHSKVSSYYTDTFVHTEKLCLVATFPDWWNSISCVACNHAHVNLAWIHHCLWMWQLASFLSCLLDTWVLFANNQPNCRATYITLVSCNNEEHPAPWGSKIDMSHVLTILHKQYLQYALMHIIWTIYGWCMAHITLWW